MKWRKGQSLDPDWEIDSGYLIEIDGRPTIRTKIDILPPPDFQATTFGEFMVLGDDPHRHAGNRRHPQRGRRRCRGS